MFYKSTRNSEVKVSSAQAIAQGISEDGGLFVPSEIPAIRLDDIKALVEKSYAERAFFVFSKYLTDFTEAEIRYCVEGAYNTKNFDTDNIAELAHLIDGTYMLELWHGPTCAIKDMALQILPYLLTTSIKKLGVDKKVVILVATSGVTGNAALEGSKDVDCTEILLFYPEDGVSAMQKKQMTTQEGGNVGVCAIKGNFDDAQTGVKTIFTSKETADKLAENGMMFSSANSMNWGRLAPQIIYKVSTYAQLVADGEIELGDKINIVVPTGNFGNILAGYYAKHMGVPGNKLICASNANNVLTDFFATGTYDKKRDFKVTTSPSMDILVSSNLERLIFHLLGNDAAKTKELMDALVTKGEYTLAGADKDILDLFAAGFATEDETAAEIKRVYDEDKYIEDPHTAVASAVYEAYVQKTDDHTPTVIASTASPYKFPRVAISAVTGKDSGDDFKAVEDLHQLSGVAIPAAVNGLEHAEVRHKTVVAAADMQKAVESYLGV